MDESWTVTVDHNVCAGSGSCAALAPQYFELDDGASHPVNELVEPDDSVIDAAETCPTGAISVHDAAGNRVRAH
jgi:ferredoxin